jgi:SAM-dependent methyltransferase
MVLGAAAVTQQFWNPSVDEAPSNDIKELAASRSFGSVLDIGCGSGRNLAPFAARGCRLYGIDIDHGAVSTTRQRLRDTVADSLDVQLGDVRSYAAERQFDLVICHGVLHFLRRAERRDVYSRLASCVASGGLISVVMFNSRIPIPDDLRGLIPEPAEDSNELRSAFPGWTEVRFRSYDYEDEHDGGRIKHVHSIDRLIAQAPASDSV